MEAEIQVPVHQPYDMDIVERIVQRYEKILEMDMNDKKTKRKTNCSLKPQARFAGATWIRLNPSFPPEIGHHDHHYEQHQYQDGRIAPGDSSSGMNLKFIPYSPARKVRGMNMVEMMVRSLITSLSLLLRLER